MEREKKMRKVATGFIEFIRKQGVVGLAVGFVLGGSVSKLVTALVNDIINPLIGILLGRAKDLASYSIKIGGTELMWGDFASQLIDFVTIALVVYGAFKILQLDKLDLKEEKAKK